jgi:hypothetical protein
VDRRDGEPLAEYDDERRADDGGRVVRAKREPCDVGYEQHVVGDHAAADPAEEGRTEHDDERETIHQRQHKTATPNNDGNGKEQSEDHEPEAVFGSPGNADDVIEAHHGISEHDGFDCAH